MARISYPDLPDPDIPPPVERIERERERVELTATIAAYNLVSRFLEALQVDPE